MHTKHPTKSIPVLRLPSLLIKNNVSKFVAAGTVPPPSGHSLTPETLELCVVRNGFALIVHPLRCNSCHCFKSLGEKKVYLNYMNKKQKGIRTGMEY